MISVVIPVYNVEKYLHVCINSVLRQTYQDFEVICIDDASTDSSLEILEYFAKKDSRIKVLVNESNKGPGYSRNRCIEVAKGKYLLFVDGDDWLSADTMETVIDKAEKNDLDVLMFKSIVYYEESGDFGMENYYDMIFMDRFVHKVFNQWDLDKTKIFKVPVGVWNKLYLKSFLDENNIRFTNENYINEDNPFSCKVLLTAKRISLIDEYFYNRRRREGSIMTLTNDRLFDVFFIVCLVLETFLENSEIYEYHKEKLLIYIFESVLDKKYDAIDTRYKEKFFIEVQNTYKKFIKEYGLYKDIKQIVNEKILKRFKFEELVEELLFDNS
ncbi:glycosyltransferase family 2 protein [Methanobrevibacter sp.]|uniref:glycosyltransferase family 2 protein n=1 Tax=Methanobrevibacter sp. TaxID=66852 RepID=UPI00388D1E89